MRSIAELRVPMVPVVVEIAGIDGGRATCEVYVPDVPRHGQHALADDLATLVDSDRPFLPVRTSDAVALVAVHAIRWLALATRNDTTQADGVPTEVSEPEPSEVLTLFDSKHDVEVTLDDGTVLTGAILHSSPADKPRVIDYLNRATRFVRLWTPRAQYLINKQHVARVREIGDAERDRAPGKE
jgi:hypothetical protein